MMDDYDIAVAQKVWRWNIGGLGFSRNGYNGPYTTAITQDGRIVADFITAGTLNAAMVKVINLIADHVKSVDGIYTLELDAANLSLDSKTGRKIRINASTMEGRDQGVVFA